MDKPVSATAAARLEEVRKLLEADGLDGFIVPQADPHLGEYISDDAQRLFWLTGFAGSAGTAVMIGARTALFVDGRYFLQASRQFEGSAVEVRHFREPPLGEWLAGEVADGARIGFDARLHAISQIESLRKSLKENGAELVVASENPIDRAWSDQPLPPAATVHVHPLEYAGRSTDDKLADIAEALDKAKADAVVLNQMDSLAWAFNVRGGDTANTPLVQGYGVVHSDGAADFYVDPDKLEEGVEAALGNRISVRPIGELDTGLAELGQAEKTVLLDRNSANEAIRLGLAGAGAKVVFGQDPVMLPRARKNETEIAGAKAAHERDGAAMCRFLRWLDETSATRDIGEIEAAAKMDAFRAEQADFMGLSFGTIAGADANGAIVHYRVSEESERTLGQGSLFLLDSGGQYLDGTTDITRTIPIGTPSEDMRRHFTLVLKGHISVATAHFPASATGGQLDALARQHLWADGLDYDHGTGHGVGAYLGVHEGPQRMAPGSDAKLEPGMIISNEPGLYLADHYGIRIENLLLVKTSEKGGERKFLCFEPLTLAPIDRRLIDTGLLTEAERAWLDAYHQRVAVTIGPELAADDRAWLEAMTAALD